MDKELENLLDNYENSIYGKAFPITPSTHQLHLLLDYIANLEQQCKQQKEVINKAIELLNKFSFRIETDNRTMYIRLKYLEQGKDLLKTLKEVSEWMKN